jgi:predicted O-linked N-acetylglucosamine transferase (SPINDLY family)
MSDSKKIFNDALAALNGNDLSRAEKLFRRVIKFDKSSVSALNFLVVVLMRLARFAEAEPFIARATLLNKNSDVSFYNYGLISKHLNKSRQALDNFSKALDLNPNVPDTWNNRGTVFNDLKDYESAIADFDKALALNPNYGEAYANKGKSLTLLKRYQDACPVYDKALAINPNLESAWLGRGNVLAWFKRHDDALVAYERALSIKPDLAEAWGGRGNVFYGLKRHDEARAAYNKALSIKPDLPEAWLGCGNVCAALKRYEDALVAYDKAFAIKPDLEIVESARLYTKMRLCNWDNLENEIGSLTASIRAGTANPPFPLLSLVGSPDDQLRCARSWVAAQHPSAEESIWRGPIYKHDKIRIGYVSPDFRPHPVSYLMAGVLEAHCSDRFKTYGFSIGARDSGELRSRLESSFHKFFDCHNKHDSEIVNAIRSSEIDILVDLAGYTQDARPSLFEYRPAPIVVNYLGFAGTLGSSRLWDYIVADRIVAPDGSAEYFEEKLARLPGCFMPHDDKGRSISDDAPSRIDHGLPEKGIVFCCFNNAFKINPRVLGSWASILNSVHDAVLWLADMEAAAKSNLRERAKNLGLDPDRLVFAKRVPSTAEHLARHRLADLFLDTLPYNAHTTASDALWAGLPVLTRAGDSFAGRVAASLLNSVGLPELITHSSEEYEAAAIELARDREKLNAIKGKLAANRLTASLFDTPLYTKHLEAAYEAMYQRHQARLPPEHIDVDA